MAGELTHRGGVPVRPGRSHGRQRAVGIYGTIVTAAILSSAGDRLSVPDLVVSIVVTLSVYCVAEEYAEILGEQLASGHLPTWPYVRAALAATWPMVTASFVPLLFLVAAWLLGAAGPAAANAGLGAAVVELMLYGWSAGGAASLRGKQRCAVTSAAAALGLAMIVLKDVVLIHLP
jgi:hypothetical protein